jgi:hypothetical protein
MEDGTIRVSFIYSNSISATSSRGIDFVSR